MKITIIQFKIIETLVLPASWLDRLLAWCKNISVAQYHYDIRIQLPEHYWGNARPLEVHDIMELPNKVRLMVWRVDRCVIMAKTYKFTQENMRKYHPMHAHLVYPRVNLKGSSHQSL